MQEQYSIGKYRGKFALIVYNGGKRQRYTLGTGDAEEAKRLAPSLYAEVIRPSDQTVRSIWAAFTIDRAGRAIIRTMEHTWKALSPRFGALPAINITVEDCRAYARERRDAGIKDGTIYTELGHLRMVLNWAVKRGIIPKAPHIERPSKPPPSEKYLSREQIKAVIEAAPFPHIRLFLILAITTGARSSAILGLTWARCDFDRHRVDLRDPKLTTPHKGRAIVPMNETLQRALQEAKPKALTDYVIEWGGGRVASVRKGVASAGIKAGVGYVSPHMLRHSAAVHMAEDDVPMEVIAQYLGHANVNVTRRIYARFSPSYLRKAAASLEFDV